MLDNPYLPQPAQIIERIEETPSIFTLRLRFCDPELHRQYRFQPGQFNMLYLYGVGEVPISIVSDPQDEHAYDHTIRAVGRVTHALAELRAGDVIGVRGPFGRGWPLAEVNGKDIVVITGGLGCAPVVSVIHYVVRRRAEFGRLVIMQGVKHSDDLIWRQQYEQWQQVPDTQVILAASHGGPSWPWATGHVTDLLHEARFDADHCSVMMCGPEGMMQVGVEELLARGVNASELWLSMERNMQCAVGHCGHCQHGPHFVCKDGPIFNYTQIREWFGVRGF
ncbi:MAG: FAD/NAD(P)-binding protein [Gammaproteobacteria bacterium]